MRSQSWPGPTLESLAQVLSVLKTEWNYNEVIIMSVTFLSTCLFLHHANPSVIPRVCIVLSYNTHVVWLWMDLGFSLLFPSDCVSIFVVSSLFSPHSHFVFWCCLFVPSLLAVHAWLFLLGYNFLWMLWKIDAWILFCQKWRKKTVQNGALSF